MGIYVVFAGAAANIIGTSSYFFGTLRGTTKPNRVSWFFWTLSTSIAAFAGLAAGVGLAVVPIFVGAALCFLVLLASFVNPQAFWKLRTLDYVCGFFALLALVLWFLTKNPSIAIAFAIASDMFASFPTMRKAWTHPETESPWTYFGGLFNGLSAFFVLQVWNFAGVAFPVQIVVVETIILCALYKKKLLQ